MGPVNFQLVAGVLRYMIAALFLTQINDGIATLGLCMKAVTAAQERRHARGTASDSRHDSAHLRVCGNRFRPVRANPASKRRHTGFFVIASRYTTRGHAPA